MGFIAIVVFVGLAVASAVDYDLEFVEKDKSFNEKISIDKNKGIVEFDVPDHAGVMAATFLTDYKMGLSIMKLKQDKICYAMDLSAHEATPEELEKGLKNVNFKFPKDKYMITNKNYFPTAVLEATTLSQEILDFCGGYPVIKADKLNEKEREAVVLTAVKALKSGKSKRATTTVTEFFTCKSDIQTAMTGMTCDPSLLKVKCKFARSNSCVYKVACKLATTGYECNTLDHEFSRLMCCAVECP